MAQQITITVPIPKTNQNGPQTSYLVKSGRRRQDVKRARVAVDNFLATLEEDEQANLGLPWPSATIHVNWYHKSGRFRDVWNIIGALKGTIDGLVRAGLIKDDDKLQPPTVSRLVDTNHPRVELVLTASTSPVTQKKKFGGVIR